MSCVFCKNVPGTIVLGKTKYKVCQKCFDLLKKTIRQEIGEMAPSCDTGIFEIILAFARDKGLLNDSARRGE